MSHSDWLSPSGPERMGKGRGRVLEAERGPLALERRAAATYVSKRGKAARARLMRNRYLRLVDRHNEWMVSAFIAGSGEISFLKTKCSLTYSCAARLVCSLWGSSPTLVTFGTTISFSFNRSDLTQSCLTYSKPSCQVPLLLRDLPHAHAGSRAISHYPPTAPCPTPFTYLPISCLSASPFPSPTRPQNRPVTVKFILLHDIKNDDGIRLFFLDLWEAYVKVCFPCHALQGKGKQVDRG